MTVRDTAELLALKKKVQALSPVDRLHLSAELVSLGKFAIAEVIAGEVVSELAALRILGGKRMTENEQ